MPFDQKRTRGEAIHSALSPNSLMIGHHFSAPAFCNPLRHKHASAAVLICVKGKGYTYSWPEALGMTPWNDGKADGVLRQDYEPVGLVSAAPMSGDWFHQHQSTSKRAAARSPITRRTDRSAAKVSPAGWKTGSINHHPMPLRNRRN
jgi:hypothetical protein